MKMANNTTKVEDAKRDVHLRVIVRNSCNSYVAGNNVVVIT